MTQMLSLKKSLSLELLTKWYSHPMTVLILNVLSETQDKENAGFITRTGVNAEEHIIERNLYRLMGKNELLKKLVDFDQMKNTVLRDYVTWDEEND